MADPKAPRKKDDLSLNLLMLLGYRNAVSRDSAVPLKEMAEIAADPQQTDGTVYGEDEVVDSVRRLESQEYLRIVRERFDGGDLIAWSRGVRPSHSAYITAPGAMFVKRELNRRRGR